MTEWPLRAPAGPESDRDRGDRRPTLPVVIPVYQRAHVRARRARFALAATSTVPARSPRMRGLVGTLAARGIEP